MGLSIIIVDIQKVIQKAQFQNLKSFNVSQMCQQKSQMWKNFL